jgi:hypothetical protein
MQQVRTMYRTLQTAESLVCQRSRDDSATSMEKTAPEMAPMPAPRTTPLSVASPITDPATAPTTDPTAAKAHVTAAQRTLQASSHAHCRG